MDATRAAHVISLAHQVDAWAAGEAAADTADVQVITLALKI